MAEITLLLSGGIDSAACIPFYRSRGFLVRGVFVNYGQASCQQERLAATRIAAHYDLPLSQLALENARPKTGGEVIGRNALLVLTALAEANPSSGLLALGIHAGTEYWDCSRSFVDCMQEILTGYCGGRLSMAAPFIDWTKPEIWECCSNWEVPVHLTYSCELGRTQPCGQCLSCKDLEALRACTQTID